MAELVLPKTYLIGYTAIDLNNLKQYLQDTDNLEFLKFMKEAEEQGISAGEILCSFYAKLCYKSLTLGKNENVKKIRDIKSNLENVIDTGHGSCLEHCYLNFITTDCSRVFTHEAIRHRVGTSYSQTSLRYVKINKIKLAIPPEYNFCQEDIIQYLQQTEQFVEYIGHKIGFDSDSLPFDTKKKMTSFLRRLIPDGVVGELGWGVNIRSLRHIIELRTNVHSEWEIRYVFNQVANIIKERFPGMLYGCQEELKDGLIEYTNLHV